MTSHERAAATKSPPLATSAAHAELSNWHSGGYDVVDLASELIIGEIFWRKSIGRPRTSTLSEAFNVYAWTVTDPKGKDSPLPYVPRLVKLKDAKDDVQFWRVSYVVFGVEAGHHELPFDIPSMPVSWDDYTHVVPKFNNVQWEGPVSSQSDISVYRPYRVFVPFEIVFLKSPVADSQSIQIVQSHLMPANVKIFSDE